MTRAMLCAVLLWSSLGAQARDYADVHLHYTDFFQQSAGAEQLEQALDAAGIREAVLLGMPVVKKWEQHAPREPRYYQGDEAPIYYYSAADPMLLQALDRMPERLQARLFPFLSGFNPTDLNAVDHVRQMLDAFPGRWAGIGEILTRHDDMTAMVEGETPRANHPALIRVYALAAERQLPVLLHSNITSKRERTPIYLNELVEALEAAPRTTFIWAHAGTAAEIHRRQEHIEDLDGIVADLLERFPRLYIDLSWSLLDHYLLDEQGRPDPAWVVLVQRFPDRFMAGSDVVGRFGSLKDIMARYDRFLEALPEPVAERVARDNLLRLLKPGRERADSQAAS